MGDAAERRRRRSVNGLARTPNVMRRKKASRPKTGKGLERKYAFELQQLLEPIFEAIENQLKPALNNITTRAAEEFRVDEAYSEIITRTFNGVRISVAGQLPDPLISQLVDKHGQSINAFSGRQTDATFKSVLGIAPVRAEPYLASQLATFTQRNIQLIKSIPTKFLDDVEAIVRIGVDRGQSIAEISKAITQKTQAAKSRATRIAVDQVQKFNGKLNELRQKEVGVTHYIWSTSRDIDVRDAHKERQGKKFAWDNPPEDGHPGEAINCRCAAIPVMDGFIADVEKMAA